MENITKTREALTQVQLSCLEVAHGCEQLQTIEFNERELELLAIALFEMHAAVEKLFRSSLIDPKLDHDGDTQPANEPPEPPVCKCGHAHRDHMPASFTAEPSGAIAAAMLGFSAGCCIYCLCERFDP